jgi:hypothetical protein
MTGRIGDCWNETIAKFIRVSYYAERNIRKCLGAVSVFINAALKVLTDPNCRYCRLFPGLLQLIIIYTGMM